MHFDAHADTYADARPPYPAALWQRLRELGVLQPGRRALDLGARTGQATGPLLDAGVEVTAVEPGSRLAARLRDAHPGATVLVVRPWLRLQDISGHAVDDDRSAERSERNPRLRPPGSGISSVSRPLHR